MPTFSPTRNAGNVLACLSLRSRQTPAHLRLQAYKRSSSHGADEYDPEVAIPIL